jgi:predicted AAA+ superfamily ATPase
LNVAHETAERWVTILENLYMVFRITPYGAPRTKAVKKEQKLYFWDHTDVTSGGPRFENLVASQLLKYCHFREDTEGYRMELRFLRDVEGREIDFVVMEDGKPSFAVECKTGEKALSPAIRYFKARTPIPRYFQVHMGSRDFEDASTGARVLPYISFCKEMKMP